MTDAESQKNVLKELALLRFDLDACARIDGIEKAERRVYAMFAGRVEKVRGALSTNIVDSAALKDALDGCRAKLDQTRSEREADLEHILAAFKVRAKGMSVVIEAAETEPWSGEYAPDFLRLCALGLDYSGDTLNSKRLKSYADNLESKRNEWIRARNSAPNNPKADSCANCGYVAERPVNNCGHVGGDGCCQHPYNMTPECHNDACPLVPPAPKPEDASREARK